ncbi:hypothetical protein T492DRAFT_887747 [Pavlovales sp. CCMP2436]|nr:hypothetical protein T492DRAFT_887747 [Pavlovales sp. CCMP2436]
MMLVALAAAVAVGAASAAVAATGVGVASAAVTLASVAVATAAVAATGVGAVATLAATSRAARGGGDRGGGRGFFAHDSPTPGSNMAMKESWLRAKVKKLVDARWDTTQFLHELAGRLETLDAFKACFVNIDADVAGQRVLNALMPALASREMCEALNRERANLVFTQVRLLSLPLAFPIACYFFR